MSESIVARIQAVSDRLTPTEQRLVAALIAAPREVALASSAEFAARAAAHEATTSRLARKLGFANYAAFRSALRREWLTGPDSAARISTTLRQAEGRALERLIAAEIACLAEIGRHVDEAALVRAAEMIDRPRLFIFAQGNATILAQMMERRLRRMGVSPVLLVGSARDIAEQAVAIGAADALLVLAFRRQPRLYAPLMAAAREAGAATLAVSDVLGAMLSPAPDLVLASPRNADEGAFQTLTAPMLICNALVLALGARMKDDALSALERLDRLIGSFEGDGQR